MLTIKVVRPDGQKYESGKELYSCDFSEFVEETKSVFLNTSSQSASGHPSVTYFKEDGRAIDVYEGTVYVMNSSGKTIAKYDLGYGYAGMVDVPQDKPTFEANSVK